MKTDIFEKLLFSVSTKRMKASFLKILIIFKKLSKYMKSDFFDKRKSEFLLRKAETSTP